MACVDNLYPLGLCGVHLRDDVSPVYIHTYVTVHMYIHGFSRTDKCGAPSGSLQSCPGNARLYYTYFSNIGKIILGDVHILCS